jgi:Kdo2-lipid IVA lauroyltransferase/acyltransferase
MEILTSFFLKYSFKFIGFIPRTWTIKLANFLGLIWYIFDKRHRKIAMENLHLAYGKEKTNRELQQIVKSVFQNITKIPFEIAWSLRIQESEFLKYFEIKGSSNLLIALGKGKGALLLTAHTGNWEFMPAINRYTGYPLNIIYNPIKNQFINDFIFGYRTRFGAKMIPKKRSLRKVMSALKNNECVGILLDQNPHRANGVFVDFFGRSTLTSKGLAFLAIKTKAPVIPVFISRQGIKYLVEFGSEIPLSETSDFEKDLRFNTLLYNKSIENFIRKYPDQWFWVHRRWKNTPREH